METKHMASRVAAILNSATRRCNWQNADLEKVQGLSTGEAWGKEGNRRTCW